MAQKILSARSGDPTFIERLTGGMLRADVDQIALVHAPARAHSAALSAGLKKPSAEVAVAYDTRCVAAVHDAVDEGNPAPTRVAAGELLARGILVARAGAGFPGPVHLERFASPGRFCVTDDPRLAGVGGIGMLTLVVPTASLGQALAHGTVLIRPPISVQVLLTGRLRPFVCARDVALELVRRGLRDVVRRAEEARGAPVVLEFAGPSARLLSVGERSVIAAMAPQVGAAAALFLSDERTEVFLRDQRRSKAHRTVMPDAGAPCEEVVTVDLGGVDPLALDEHGQVRIVRDLAGQTVTQALLGGDSGATLRDLFAVAALLKSKRVPARMEFLVAPPSRQMLEVLASAGALTDLIASGARLVEPDGRVVSGELYAPSEAGRSMRTCDPEPRPAGRIHPFVASAETLAYAVATGEVGDPRNFKRPVRVTVPRTLPTDDVLIARKPNRNEAHPLRGSKRDERRAGVVAAMPPWTDAQTLVLVDGVALGSPTSEANVGAAGASERGSLRAAVVCDSLDEVRDLSARAYEIAPRVGAVLASYIPGSLVALFSAVGIAAIRLDGAAAKALKGQKTLAMPAPSQWSERDTTLVAAGGAKVSLTWLALGVERAWATGAPGELGDGRAGDGRAGDGRDRRARSSYRG